MRRHRSNNGRDIRASCQKERIKSIIDNPDLNRGNPPPIRPRRSEGLVIQRPPESVWERRVRIARDFPETMKSKDVYDRLELDCQKPGDKKVVSRVMRAAGFVAKRGRRGATWERVRKDAEYSLSTPPPHHTDSVTVTPESTM